MDSFLNLLNFIFDTRKFREDFKFWSSTKVFVCKYFGSIY